MAHLLMIESWMLSSGILLPKIIRRMGHTYTFLCGDSGRYASFVGGKAHPAMALAQQTVTCDTNSLDRILETLDTLQKEISFDGVITSCDYYLVTVAQIAEYLGLPSVSAIATKIANNKAMMREALQRAGLHSPKFARVDNLAGAREAADSLGYPLIIKPTDLCGSLLVQKVATPDELETAFTALHQYELNARDQKRENAVLLEEFLDGLEFSVESFTCRGRTGFFGITDKSLFGESCFVESGHMFPAVLEAEAEEALYQCVRNALIAVGYDHGLAHTEVKLTSRGPRIVEINTRAGGNWISELIRHVRGVNPLEYAVRLALGEELDTKIQTAGGSKSAAIQFLIPERAGTIKAVHGWAAAQNHPDVIEALLHPHVSGKAVEVARDNDAYLGYIMCRDQHGYQARVRAETLVADLYVEIEGPLEQAPAPIAEHA